MSDRGFRIKTIHAIVGLDVEDDEEGVPAWIMPGMSMPLIAADETRLTEITRMAQQIANATGETFKLVRFSVREEIREIKPNELMQ